MEEFQKDRNVVILSTPRTGSSALCRRIADDNNLINHKEAFHPDHDSSAAVWKDLSSGARFICKIFPNHNITEQQLDLLCEDSLVIFLERENLAEQIASYHSLGTTNKAWYAKDEPSHSYQVSLDSTKISQCIRRMLELRKAAEAYRHRAHISLKYEDIVDSIENDHMRRYDRPDNYDQLLGKIQRLLPIFLGDRG
jgi:LPS sulfotransferase NodH